MTEVVTAFVIHDGRILVLRQGDERGKWDGVGGRLEGDPLEGAYSELRQEIGLEAGDVELVKRGEPLHVLDPENKRTWRVHPFLFAVDDTSRIRLDEAHTSRRWVWPGEIDRIDTVPGLADALHRVYP